MTHFLSPRQSHPGLIWVCFVSSAYLVTGMQDLLVNKVSHREAERLLKYPYHAESKDYSKLVLRWIFPPKD